MGADVTVYELIDPSVTSEFVGYDRTQTTSRITVLTTETEIVEALSDGEVGTVIVEQTPFYATMGGQQGDKGVIRTASGTFEVEDTIPLLGGKIGHIGKMTGGMIKNGDEAELIVDAKLRAKTCRNHSATHLLQKALREVLGTHVEQAGSYQDGERTRFDFSHFAAMTPEEISRVEQLVNEKIAEHIAVDTQVMTVSYQDGERTRFDFSHFAAMTPEEISRVEQLVNEKIAEHIAVDTQVMTVEEAKKTGAMALFGEKYGEKVRVVSMSDFSKEFCGGTHVKNTADIIAFKIISESGVAAGVRRIEALTGSNVFAYYRREEEELLAAAKNTADIIAFKIISESGVAAGVRRIEALTGSNVFAYYRREEEELLAAAKAAKTTPAGLAEKIAHMQEQIKALQSENESLKSKAAKEALGDVMDQVTEVGGVKLLAASVPGVDMNGLRELGDQLKEKLGEGVVVLASEADGKVSLVAMATDGAMAKGAHAGNLIKAIAGKVGGGGGGRPNMAQAGGKNPAGIPEAVAETKTELEVQLSK